MCSNICSTYSLHGVLMILCKKVVPHQQSSLGTVYPRQWLHMTVLGAQRSNARFQHLSFKFNFPLKISFSLKQGGGGCDPGSQLVKLTFAQRCKFNEARQESLRGTIILHLLLRGYMNSLAIQGLKLFHTISSCSFHFC